MIGIKAIAPFFAGGSTPAGDLLAGETLPPAERAYYRQTGIESVHEAHHCKSFNLAMAACTQVLEKSSTEAEEIDLIIYIQSRLPEYFISSDAARLQHELGASNANVFSVGDLGCADMSMAVKLGKDFLYANPEAAHVLICYGSKAYVPSRFRYPVTINGDGGLAVLLARTDTNRIVDVGIRTKGSYWNLFQVDYKDKPFGDYREVCTDHRKYGFELAIESRNQFGELNEELLRRNGLVPGDVGHYLMQNISARAYEYYHSAFGITISPVCQHNLSRYGHLGPADVLLNFLTGLENGLFRPDDYVLIMNNSPVAAWSTILIQI